MPLDDVRFGLDAFDEETVHAMTSEVRIYLPRFILTGMAHEFGLTEVEVRDDLLTYFRGGVIDRVPTIEGKTMLEYQADIAIASTFVQNGERLAAALKAIDAGESDDEAVA